MTDTSLNYGFQMPSSDGHDYQHVDNIRSPVTAIDAKIKEHHLAQSILNTANATKLDVVSGPTSFALRTQNGVPQKIIHVQTCAAVTTNSTGFATIAHGCGFTPTAVFIMNASMSASSSYPIGTDTYTATTFRVRMGEVGGGYRISASSGNIMALFIN